MILSPDIIARAIVSAAQQTGADPEQIALGVTNIGGGAEGDFSTAHARAYAALALYETYPNADRLTIARAVGAKSSAYIGQIISQRGKGGLKWWCTLSFARVVEDVQTAARFSHITDEPRVPDVHRVREADAPPINMRKRVSANCESRTAELMGDPPPGRSALDQRGGRA